MRLTLSDVRRYNSTLIIFNVIALTGALFFINNLIASYSSSSSSVSAAAGVQTVNVSAVLHSLSAAFVRVETPTDRRSSAVRLVLSVDTADLTDFMDSWQRGFTAEQVRYPDDGGILLHNRDLCRGARPLDWVVYVHTSPGNQRRRQLLRDTWANHDLFKHLNFRVVFLLGKYPPESSNLQACFTRVCQLVVVGPVKQLHYASSSVT